MFLNHSITLAEFFHWIMYNNLITYWFIFSKIDVLTLPSSLLEGYIRQECKHCALYRDDGLLILRNVNGQQMDQMRKNIIKTFKDIGFTMDVETNLKIAYFLDITFNLNNGTYRPYKKTNDLLLYTSKSSNQLPKIINERLSRSSSNEEVLTHLNINTRKPLETVDTPISS